jgi:hypothetical protein
LNAPSKKIPIGLARVRKAMPPPSKVFKSKKSEARQQVKERLRREIKETQPSKSS